MPPPYGPVSSPNCRSGRRTSSSAMVSFISGSRRMSPVIRGKRCGLRRKRSLASAESRNTSRLPRWSPHSRGRVRSDETCRPSGAPAAFQRASALSCFGRSLANGRCLHQASRPRCRPEYRARSCRHPLPQTVGTLCQQSQRTPYVRSRCATYYCRRHPKGITLASHGRDLRNVGKFPAHRENRELPYCSPNKLHC